MCSELSLALKDHEPSVLTGNNDPCLFSHSKFARKEEKVKESVVQEQVRVRRRQGYAAAEKRLTEKSTTVCVVDENEVIGESGAE